MICVTLVFSLAPRISVRRGELDANYLMSRVYILASVRCVGLSQLRLFPA